MKTEAKIKDKQRLILYIVIAVMVVAVVIISTVMIAASIPIRGNFNSKVPDYLFVLGLSVAFLLEISMPFLAERIFKIYISPGISLVYVIHCFGGTYLGNVANVYYLVPYYDHVMHFIMGLNLSMLGLALVQYFNRNSDGGLDPMFAAAVVLFTGIAITTLWEVFEFVADLILDMNMQRYAYENGELIAGRPALLNTMVDILLNIGGAISVAVPTYYSIKHKKNWLTLCEINKRRKVSPPAQ